MVTIACRPTQETFATLASSHSTFDVSGIWQLVEPAIDVRSIKWVTRCQSRLDGTRYLPKPRRDL
jgi:hypothetical protein